MAEADRLRESGGPADPATAPEAGRRLSDEQWLVRWLADRNEACPSCGYNLRAATQAKCPECGRHLTLTLDQVHQPLAAWTVSLLAVALCAAEGIYSIGWLLMDVFFWHDLASYSPLVLFVMFLMIGNVPLLLAVVVSQRWFIRWPAAAQWSIASVLTAVAVLIFALYWVAYAF